MIAFLARSFLHPDLNLPRPAFWADLPPMEPTSKTPRGSKPALVGPGLAIFPPFSVRGGHRESAVSLVKEIEACGAIVSCYHADLVCVRVLLDSVTYLDRAFSTSECSAYVKRIDL
jgi:hypothetical protein